MAKLNYKTLRQEVADEIRKKILSGEFEAGQRIKENEIAELFGVSRGPVREALRQIEQEGLITYERNIGCSVTHITQRDLDEISWLRATLEMLAVRLCRGEISSEALKQIQESLERMRSLGEDRYQLAQEDNLFHGCVIGQIGFHKLAHIWKSTDLSNFPAFCMQLLSAASAAAGLLPKRFGSTNLSGAGTTLRGRAGRKRQTKRNSVT